MAESQLLHLVARTASGARPFRHRHACAELWSRISRNFEVIALVLMPDHVHLLTQVDQKAAMRIFGRVLSAFRIRMQAIAMPELTFEWERIPSPQKVQRDQRHIARTIRYIHLNPTRDFLCGDPLEWEWSTHRDWLGAVAQPCVDRARWASAMGKRWPSCTGWLHEYVSSDPSVPRPCPPPNPEPFLRSGTKDASIDALLQAVPRALRSHRGLPHEFGLAERRLFLLSAARWTRYSGARLARTVGCHPTSAQRTVRRERSGKVLESGDADRVAENGRAANDHAVSIPEAARSSASRHARRDSLTADESHAMAMILADPRLSAEGSSAFAPGAREAASRNAASTRRRSSL